MIPSTLTYSWPAVTGSFLYPWQTEMGRGTDGGSEIDWLDSIAPLAAFLLKPTTSQTQVIDATDHSCISVNTLHVWARVVGAPFWDLPFHSLLIMHFSLLTKGQWSLMEGKMCRGNTEHTMCIITYHKTEQKPKGKIYFPQNSLSSISSHNW